MKRGGGSIPPPRCSDREHGDAPSPPREKGTEMVWVAECSKPGTTGVAAEHKGSLRRPVWR